MGDFGDLPAYQSDAASKTEDPRAVLFFELAKASVDLAMARKIEAGAEPGDAEAYRASAQSRLQMAHQTGPADEQNPEGTPAPTERWSDVRVMLRLIEGAKP